jgi:hypothetical protein
MNYTTLADAKAYLKLTSTSEDDLLSTFITWATDYINFYKGRRYDPRVETRVFDVPSSGASVFGQFDSRLQAPVAIPPLRLDEDLLELKTLTNGDTTVITDYLLEPANNLPKTRIRLKGGVSWEPDADGNYRQAISVLGVWGAHDNYSQAWQNSLSSLSAGISASVTSFAVTTIAPFKAGQLARIDDEFMLVTAVATVLSVPTLTVERGYNGSTAAAHLISAGISIFRPQGNVVQACLRLVKWRYVQKDVDLFDKTYSADTGMTIVPTAVPVDVKAVLGAPKAYL